MTKYQRNLIRLWDSLRKNVNYMGDLSCEGVNCNDCPFHEVCYNVKLKSTIGGADKAIEIVNKWVEEHPEKELDIDLFNAARALQKMCTNTLDCIDCDFYHDGCRINVTPEYWNIE